MKKILPLLCCAVGSGMIGFFANRLDTAVGGFCFSLGVAMLVCSFILFGEKEDTD